MTKSVTKSPSVGWNIWIIVHFAFD